MPSEFTLFPSFMPSDFIHKATTGPFMKYAGRNYLGARYDLCITSPLALLLLY